MLVRDTRHPGVSLVYPLRFAPPKLRHAVVHGAHCGLASHPAQPAPGWIEESSGGSCGLASEHLKPLENLRLVYPWRAARINPQGWDSPLLVRRTAA